MLYFEKYLTSANKLEVILLPKLNFLDLQLTAESYYSQPTFVNFFVVLIIIVVIWEDEIQIQTVFLMLLLACLYFGQ